MEILKPTQKASASPVSRPGTVSVQKDQTHPLFQPSSQREIDRLELSRAALARLQQPDQEKQRSFLDLLSPEKKDTSQEMDSLKKMMEVMKLCAEIASRIRHGDNVPQKDMDFLINADPSQYLMAMLMRESKENPKEWDSVVPDEEPAQPASGLEQVVAIQNSRAAAQSAPISPTSSTSSGEL